MATHASSLSDPPTVVQSVSPAKGLATLAVVVVAVAGFIGISTALGLASAYGGFLFVFYFTSLCHAAPEKFMPAVVGAFCGLTMAALLTQLPETMGSAGMAIALSFILAAIYAMIMGWVPILVNNATMLFLTVGTIPALHATATIAEMALSVLLAAAILGVAGVIIKLRAAR